MRGYYPGNWPEISRRVEEEPDLLTGAREGALGKRRPHIPVMASSPMRNLRKTGAVDENGNLIAIPRLPSVAGANKPSDGNQWSAAENVEHLHGSAAKASNNLRIGFTPPEIRI
jgi:hypothetical protein